MIKNMISIINHGMYNNELSIECAKMLIEELSALTGKKYSILRKRVVYKENGQFHDAWANA